MLKAQLHAAKVSESDKADCACYSADAGSRAFTLHGVDDMATTERSSVTHTTKPVYDV